MPGYVKYCSAYKKRYIVMIYCYKDLPSAVEKRKNRKVKKTGRWQSMTDRELRKLSRRDLLELLIQQDEEMEALK